MISFTGEIEWGSYKTNLSTTKAIKREVAG
jgi:hypothetical protein